MKRITHLIITALIIISTVCVNTLTVNAAEVKKPRTYDMVIGVNQSGKITDDERVYYKVSVPSYTTFIIDYDEVNIVSSHWYSDLSIINEEITIIVLLVRMLRKYLVVMQHDQDHMNGMTEKYHCTPELIILLFILNVQIVNIIYH